jgi:L-threonine kinase
MMTRSTATPERTVVARATVRTPGTCGELVQGTRDGVLFHVTSPINVFSTVTVWLTAETGVCGPGDSPKAVAAVNAALRHFSAPHGANVAICSELPRAKGMASSTADVAGAIAACALALGKPLPPREIVDLALTIEPTDGSPFPGIVVFDHRGGAVFEPIGEPPPIEVIALDFGGEVDTVAFNAVDRSEKLRRLEPSAAEALALVRRGILGARADLIGRGATLSALANQDLLPKPELSGVRDFGREVGAVGVCVGHSGTVIGLLIDPARSDGAAVLERARQAFPALGFARRCRLVGGGVRAT